MNTRYNTLYNLHMPFPNTLYNLHMPFPLVECIDPEFLYLRMLVGEALGVRDVELLKEEISQRSIGAVFPGSQVKHRRNSVEE